MWNVIDHVAPIYTEHAPNAGPNENAAEKTLQRNLLQMTAMMSSTRTVMMAMVMMRLVAMLHAISIPSSKHGSNGHPSDRRISSTRQEENKGQYSPSRHAAQRLDTPIGVALRLEQGAPCVFNRLALAVQVAQGAGANLLRLEGYPLALAQTVGAAVQAVGAGEELLALLELGIAAMLRVVGVAAAEQL